MKTTPTFRHCLVPLLAAGFLSVPCASAGWRKDESHGGHDHSGLGMSIVKACATLLGGDCRASLLREGELTVEVFVEASSR